MIRPAATAQLESNGSREVEDVSSIDERLEREAERLYRRYVRPSEHEHWGEYVAVSQHGQVILGASLSDLTPERVAPLGGGHFAFRVGDVVLSKIR